jgi:uncharacterized protein (DUF1330 family)
MTANIIVDIQVTDPIGYEEYQKPAPPCFELYEGKYTAHGGKTETIEGDWSPGRPVIFEFENSEQAKKWLTSAEYSQPRQLLHETATSNMVFIDGV